MKKQTTTIKIDHDTWKGLSALKNVGDDFNTVIKRLLNKNISTENGHGRNIYRQKS